MKNILLKKISKTFITILIVLSIFTCNIFAINFLEVKIGDEVIFGRYDIDGEVKDLEWYVLDIYDNKMLLFSKYIIDCKPYTDIKNYLSDIFINNFTEEEKSKTVYTENNIRIDDEGIEERLKKGFVMDNIFTLNSDDIKKYFYDENGEVKDKRVIGIGTEKAYAHGLNKIYFDEERKKYTSPYWVGEKGYEMGFFKTVSYDGKIMEDGYYKSRFDCGIRPAIIIKID